jgi:apoptosis-resistant E3 ubiquitin protein ligase 1
LIVLGGMMVVSVSVAGLVTLAAMTQPALAPEAKHTLLQYVTGKYLLPGNCRVNFEWEEPQIVGETMTFTVRVNKIKPISLNQDHYMYLF